MAGQSGLLWTVSASSVLRPQQRKRGASSKRFAMQADGRAGNGTDHFLRRDCQRRNSLRFSAGVHQLSNWNFCSSGKPSFILRKKLSNHKKRTTAVKGRSTKKAITKIPGCDTGFKLYHYGRAGQNVDHEGFIDRRNPKLYRNVYYLNWEFWRRQTT